MSTKIHNGYRLAEGTSPFEFARRVRAALDPVRDRTDAALLATLFATAVDKHWVNGQPIAPVLAFTALSDWEDRQQSMPKDSRAHDPNGFEMCLGEDPATGRILVRAYTQHPDLAEAFAAMPEIEPYSYWNNADAPDTLTEEDWADREAAWARVMPHYAAPAEHMLSFVLRTPANPRTLMLCSMNGGAEDPVLTRFPDRAARARTAARMAYVRHLIEAGADGGEAVLHTLDRRDALDTVAAVLEPLLPELTRDLLLEGTAGMTPEPALLAAWRPPAPPCTRPSRARQPSEANITSDYPGRRCRFFRYRRMISGMPPSEFHRFYVCDVDTVVELRWKRPVYRAARRSDRILDWLAALLDGRRADSPAHNVSQETFEECVDLMVEDLDSAVDALSRLGYDVTVREPELRVAA